MIYIDPLSIKDFSLHQRPSDRQSRQRHPAESWIREQSTRPRSNGRIRFIPPQKRTKKSGLPEKSGPGSASPSLLLARVLVRSRNRFQNRIECPEQDRIPFRIPYRWRGNLDALPWTRSSFKKKRACRAGLRAWQKGVDGRIQTWARVVLSGASRAHASSLARADTPWQRGFELLLSRSC